METRLDYDSSHNGARYSGDAGLNSFRTFVLLTAVRALGDDAHGGPAVALAALRVLSFVRIRASGTVVLPNTCSGNLTV